MEAFDLRAISSLAPMGDLTAGIMIMLVAALVAHAAFVPKLCAHSWRKALVFLAVSLLAFLGVISVLPAHPRQLYLASAAYVAVFFVAGCLASRQAPGERQLRARALLGAAGMLVAVAVAWFAAFMPR